MSATDNLAAIQRSMFTFAELDVIKSNFEKGDKDGDYMLDLEEFRALIVSPEKQLTDDDSKSLFKLFDTNANGKISYREFISTLTIITKGTNKEKLEFLFEFYDRDADGVLTTNEIVVLLNHIQKVVEGYSRFSDDAKKARIEAEALVLQLDTDEDGKISISEWLDFGEKSTELIDVFSLLV